jgi:hypothetical protein
MQIADRASAQASRFAYVGICAPHAGWQPRSMIHAAHFRRVASGLSRLVLTPCKQHMKTIVGEPALDRRIKTRSATRIPLSWRPSRGLGVVAKLRAFFLEGAMLTVHRSRLKARTGDRGPPATDAASSLTGFLIAEAGRIGSRRARHLASGAPDSDQTFGGNRPRLFGESKSPQADSGWHSRKRLLAIHGRLYSMPPCQSARTQPKRCRKPTNNTKK